jgi:hypothetical protein
MTHREIQRSSLMFESGVRNVGASSLDRAVRIVVCLPISDLAGKGTQTQARPNLSNIQLRRCGETSPMHYASHPRDHLGQDCKPHSTPI